MIGYLQDTNDGEKNPTFCETDTGNLRRLGRDDEDGVAEKKGGNGDKTLGEMMCKEENYEKLWAYNEQTW